MFGFPSDALVSFLWLTQGGMWVIRIVCDCAGRLLSSGCIHLSPDEVMCNMGYMDLWLSGYRWATRESHSNLIRYYFLFHRKPVIPTEGNRCNGRNFQLNIASPSLQSLACTNSTKKGGNSIPASSSDVVHIRNINYPGNRLLPSHKNQTLYLHRSAFVNRRNTIRSRARIRHGVGTSKKRHLATHFASPTPQVVIIVCSQSVECLKWAILDFFPNQPANAFNLI